MTDRLKDTDLTLTRRTAIKTLAGAGAASLLNPAGALGAKPAAPTQSVFSVFVGWLEGLSGEVAAPRTFQLVGVQWSGPRDVSIQLRARQPGGRWSPWAEASVLGHGPDLPARSTPLIGDGIWTGPARLVELRSSRPLTDVQLHFVDVGPIFSAETASLPMAQPVLDAGPGQPPIIARQAWARGHAPPAVPPSYGAIKMAFVHHTDNPNGYSAGEVPALLKAIYIFHRFVRGWDDIGYNFVIDLQGRIWEARKGGIDEPVVGAQAGGYNEESTGVAILGTFASVLPSPAAISALQKLLAWKLSLHGVPTEGLVTVVVDPADAFYTPFKPGAHVSLPRVAGHRDGDLTDCPGNALYYHLPVIRPQVTAEALSQGTPLQASLSASASRVARGASVNLSGVLQDLDGTPVSGASIELQRITADGAFTFATATTSSDGSFGASLTVNGAMSLRALYYGPPAAASGSVQVTVPGRHRHRR